MQIIEKFNPDISECLARMSDYQARIEATKEAVKSEKEYLDYLTKCIIEESVLAVRQGYDVANEKELWSTLWQLYWRMPDIKVKVIQDVLGGLVGEIKAKDLLQDIKRDAEITTECAECTAPITIQAQSRAAMKGLNNSWSRLLCPGCKMDKQERDREANAGVRAILAQQESRLEELKSMPYREYLQTPEWQARRQQALKRAGYHCQLCDHPGTLNVHHRTYERRGEEHSSDLIVLCQGCHERHHLIGESNE